MTAQKIQTKDMILMALFAGLTAILSQLSIPLPFTPVPINLAMLSVFVAGGLLKPTYATISQIIYVLLGAIGLPVFAKLSGGLGILVGPTGGFIIGYIVAALVISLLIKHGPKKYIYLVFSMVIGLLACYTFGTFWFMFVTKSSFITSLALCVFPFLIGDALKIALAGLLVTRLLKIMK